ncbi:MAG: hypothetical protein J0L64_01270 [Acidobacteria bacterium]|nr:hypothetical protein [Acidobacteriota bacterium]
MTQPLYRADGGAAAVWATVRAELRDVPERIGGWRGALLVAAFWSGLGVYVPWDLGMDFMEPFLQAVYACSAPLFQSKITVASFSEDKSRRMLEGWWDPPCPRPEFLLGKVLATAAAGLAGALVLYALALATLTAAHGSGRLMTPPAAFLVPLLAASAAFSLFTACVGAMLALRVQTPAEAERSVRMAFLAFLAGLLLVGPYAPSRVKGWVASLFLPDVMPWAALAGVGLCAIASYALWLWCLRRIENARPLTIS